MAEDPKRPNELERIPSGVDVTNPFRVKPHDFGFNSEIDLDKLNQLVDELEALSWKEKQI